MAPDPLPLGAEQAVAQRDELTAEGSTVAKQEKQSEQGEPEKDQAMDDLATDFAGRFRGNPRVDTPQQHFSGFGIAQIGAPPLLEGVADARKLWDPPRHRDPGAARIDEILNKDVRLARRLHCRIDERDDEDEPDQEGEDERRENPLPVPAERSNQPPVQGPESDRQYRGPTECREVAV